MSEATVSDIYDELISGRAIKMRFESIARYLTFRSLLYAHKKKTEQYMIMLDIITDEQTLSITDGRDDEDGSFTCIFRLTEKKVRASKWAFDYVDDEGNKIDEELLDMPDSLRD